MRFLGTKLMSDMIFFQQKEIQGRDPPPITLCGQRRREASPCILDINDLVFLMDTKAKTLQVNPYPDRTIPQKELEGTFDKEEIDVDLDALLKGSIETS